MSPKGWTQFSVKEELAVCVRDLVVVMTVKHKRRFTIGTAIVQAVKDAKGTKEQGMTIAEDAGRLEGALRAIKARLGTEAQELGLHAAEFRKTRWPDDFDQALASKLEEASARLQAEVSYINITLDRYGVS
jgi:hypothetical protein